MKKLISILRFLVPYWLTALVSVICNLLAALFSVISFTMVIPFLGLLFSTQEFVSDSIPFNLSVDSVQHNFNYILGSIVEEKGSLKALLFIIIVVFAFTILKNVFLFIGKSLIIKIRINVVEDIRNDLMNKILDFDLSYFSEERRGDIISKMIIDVKEIEMSVISSLEMLFKDPILLIVYLYVLMLMSVKLTLIVVLIFPFSALIITQIGKTLKKKTFRGQQKMGALIGMLEETLAGIKIVKAFNAERYVEHRFNKLNQYYSNLFGKVWRRRTLANPVSDIISIVSILIIMWFGGQMVLSGSEGLSSQLFIGYLAVFTQIIGPAKSFSGGYYTVIKGMASIDRINSILTHQFKITEKPNAIQITDFNHSIEFNNVTFSYEENKENILHNISFSIQKGQTVALVGHSGSGKSTIADLIPRFFDPDSGEVLLDGKSLKDYNINDLRNLFAYVNQEPIIFNDTIYNNILFGKPLAPKDEVENASKLAYAHEFIINKDLAYHTNLGEDGSKLSIGEKQRISIARALLKNSPILILDEATSSLDYQSELIVRKALAELMKNRTTIIIAHRLSTIKNADKIIVVDKGEVVQQGTHDELINQNGYYQKLSEFELL